MSKLLLMSILVATAIIPALAARHASAQVGLKRAIVGMLAFNIIYLIAVTLIYPAICW
jgi:hypothetical protein